MLAKRAAQSCGYQLWGTNMITELKNFLSTASGFAAVTLVIGVSAMPAQAQGGQKVLFQSVSGDYMMQVANENGRACSIGQYHDNQGISAMNILYDRFSAPRLTVIVPDYPDYGQGNYDIRFDISSGSESLDITVKQMSVTNPGAGTFLMTKEITRDEATELLLSGTVTATTSDGSQILSISAPSTLRREAIREYDACKGTIGEKAR